MTLKEMLQKRAAHFAAAQAIADKAKAENREMTVEEVASQTAEIEAADAIQAQIDERTAANRNANANRLAAAQADIAATTTRTTGVSQPDNQAPGRVTEVRDRTPDPRRGFSSPRDFFSAVQRGFSTGTMDRRLRDIAVVGEQGVPLATAGSDEQSVFSDPYGGLLIPEAFSSNVQMLQFAGDPVAGRTTMIPMGAPLVRIPFRVDKTHTSSVSGGLTVTRNMEAVSPSSSRQQYGRLNLQAHSLFGLSYQTEELLRDSPVSVAGLIAAGFRDEFAANHIEEFLNGTGVGEFLGINNSPALITVARNTAAHIYYVDVVAMVARCYRSSQAIWLYNREVLPELMTMKYPVDTGLNLIWQTSARDTEPDTLLGRPAYECEFLSALGTAGDLILVNPAEYLEGEYMPLETTESIHVRFLQNERTFKLWKRNAGAPWWDTVFTPKRGTNTQSPYVRLGDPA